MTETSPDPAGPLRPSPLPSPAGGSQARRFHEEQRRYFERPDVARFLWQTAAPVVAERERALLPRVAGGSGVWCLEVGCGEGANLFQLSRHGASAGTLWVGVDLYHEKVRHAAGQVPGLRAVCGRGQQLPFRGGVFRHVLTRDVFHHVLDKVALLAELRRVCAPGGTLTLIEPNGRNPIIRIFAWLHRAERDLLAMRPEVLQGLVGPGVSPLRVEFFDPFPLYRVAFHYRYGAPRLARWRWCAAAIAGAERWAARALPRDRWAYFRITLTA